MIKAVIFDCFGVLVSDGWLPFKQRHFGNNAQLFLEATNLNKQFDAGLISFSDFVEGVATLAGVPATDAYTEIQDNPANAELLQYIDTRLRGHYKIGMLSNVGENWLPDLFSEAELALFNETVLSCDVGAVKPDPRMYQAITSKLGVAPEHCIFIDDQPRYCAGAEAVGMQSITYTSTRTCITRLEQLLTIPT